MPTNLVSAALGPLARLFALIAGYAVLGLALLITAEVLLRKLFNVSLQGSAEFHRQVRALSRLFPVLDLRDTRKKLGRDAFARLPGPALILACQRASVKQVPDGWVEGDTPTWPQVLRTIYQIRCNLFHGGKSPHNRRDRDLVRRAQAVLTTFIDGSECFDWR